MMKTVKFESVEEFLQRGGVVTVCTSRKAKGVGTAARMTCRQSSSRGRAYRNLKTLLTGKNLGMGYAMTSWTRIQETA